MAMKRYGSTNALSIKARETAREIYWSEFDKTTHACGYCGRDHVPLDVHHRDGDWLNNHPMNLTALCKNCHKMLHRMRTTAESLGDWKAQIAELS